MTSVLTLMGLTLSVPDHTRVSRRAVTLPMIRAASVPRGPLHVLIDSIGMQVYGAGQWLEAKHGTKSHRTWRKLHLAVDAASSITVARTLTNQDADDPSQVGPLLDRIDDPIGQVTADGAYDGCPPTKRSPRRVMGRGSDSAAREGCSQREPGSPIQRVAIWRRSRKGHLAWQAATDYGQRSLLETTMGQYKALLGLRLRARGFMAQQTKAAMGVVVLNRMLAAGRPDSVHRPSVIASSLGVEGISLSVWQCTNAAGLH